MSSPFTANLRALLNVRYEELFHSYYEQAGSGDAEATKVCICSG